MNPNPDLRIPQMRVLKVLGECGGALSRTEIASRCGISRVCVGWAVGYSDPVKRKAYEAKEGIVSLITLACVEEREYDIDGIKETVVTLTQKGYKEYDRIRDFDLPPVHGSEQIEKEKESA